MPLQANQSRSGATYPNLTSRRRGSKNTFRSRFDGNIVRHVSTTCPFSRRVHCTSSGILQTKSTSPIQSFSRIATEFYDGISSISYTLLEGSSEQGEHRPACFARVFHKMPLLHPCGALIRAKEGGAREDVVGVTTLMK